MKQAIRINDLIMYLQNLEAEHGNVECYHSDCEWGIAALGLPKLGKIIDRPNGLMTYKSLVSDDEYANAQDTVANPETAEALGKMWDEAPEDERFMTREELITNNLIHQEREADLIRQYDAAPFSLVF